jgi:DNA-binding CsgD family transcriptional regulator
VAFDQRRKKEFISEPSRSSGVLLSAFFRRRPVTDTRPALPIARPTVPQPPEATPFTDYSFDEDLDWILEKLTDRLGGCLGVVSRLSSFGHACSTLGLSAGIACGSWRGALVTAITRHTGNASSANRRRRSDVDMPEIVFLELAGQEDGLPNHHLLCMPFDVSPCVRLVVSVARRSDAGPAFGPLELGIARTFYSVLSRYFKLWWMHRTERGQTRILSQALDRANVGVLILDARARVLFANALAFEVADGELGLSLRGCVLSAHRLDDDVRLQSTIQHAIRAGQTALNCQKENDISPVIAIKGDNSHRPLIVSVAQIYEPVLDISDAAVIVYIFDPEQEVSRPLAPICAVYGLTPVETALACRIVDGLTVKDAAKSMNVQPSTARTYLKQIFSKTRTNRQADLVRVLLSSALRMNTANGFTTV